MTFFNWLHLTDLHWGMTGQAWLWPGMKTKFFDDLEELHRYSGPWDLVIFTGDLTQSGAAGEFEEVDEMLGQLWEHLRRIGSRPRFLAVPGNHDLVRPAADLPEVVLLNEWAQRTDIHSTFWRDGVNRYRQVVIEAFKNYQDWWNAQTLKPNVNSGILPGDFSATIEKQDARLGIVGLNTTFLQLTGGNYDGKLAVDVRQFHEACEGNGPEWAEKHHACLLLTHQPPSWLTRDSQDDLNAEIAEPGRFAAHLFGHLHEGGFTRTGEAGSAFRCFWQGRSLFGLEDFELGESREKRKRLHGYSSGRIDLNHGTGMLTFWPREARVLQGGHRKIVPDQFFDLEGNIHTKQIEFSLLRAYDAPEDLADALQLANSADLSDLRKEFIGASSIPQLHDVFYKVDTLLDLNLPYDLRYKAKQLRNEIATAISRNRRIDGLRREEIRPDKKFVLDG